MLVQKHALVLIVKGLDSVCKLVCEPKKKKFPLEPPIKVIKGKNNALFNKMAHQFINKKKNHRILWATLPWKKDLRRIELEASDLK